MQSVLNYAIRRNKRPALQEISAGGSEYRELGDHTAITVCPALLVLSNSHKIPHKQNKLSPNGTTLKIEPVFTRIPLLVIQTILHSLIIVYCRPSKHHVTDGHTSPITRNVPKTHLLAENKNEELPISLEKAVSTFCFHSLHTHISGIQSAESYPRLAGHTVATDRHARNGLNSITAVIQALYITPH